MKIMIIGSTQYLDKILKHKAEQEQLGHEVSIPAFDDSNMDELELCEHNRDLIKQADRVDIIWDGRSPGTIFDFGQTFALEKFIWVVYLEPKTFCGVMEKYESKMRELKSGNGGPITNTPLGE